LPQKGENPYDSGQALLREPGDIRDRESEMTNPRGAAVLKERAERLQGLLDAKDVRLKSLEERIASIESARAEAKYVVEVHGVRFLDLTWADAASKAKALIDLGVVVDLRFK
jgi:hypothetical protein